MQQITRKDEDTHNPLLPDERIAFFHAPAPGSIGLSPSNADLSNILMAIESSKLLNFEISSERLPVHISVESETQLYIQRFYIAHKTTGLAPWM